LLRLQAAFDAVGFAQAQGVSRHTVCVGHQPLVVLSTLSPLVVCGAVEDDARCPTTWHV
jgi:hypothetical protein